MGSRTISVQEISWETPRYEQAKQWLAENDIDPARIPLESELVIADETITYERIVVDANGAAVRDGMRERVLRESVTIPKHSSPETHGL
jgi:hypothetical protein